MILGLIKCISISRIHIWVSGSFGGLPGHVHPLPPFGRTCPNSFLSLSVERNLTGLISPYRSRKTAPFLSLWSRKRDTDTRILISPYRSSLKAHHDWKKWKKWAKSIYHSWHNDIYNICIHALSIECCLSVVSVSAVGVAVCCICCFRIHCSRTCRCSCRSFRIRSCHIHCCSLTYPYEWSYGYTWRCERLMSIVSWKVSFLKVLLPFLCLLYEWKWNGLHRKGTTFRCIVRTYLLIHARLIRSYLSAWGRIAVSCLAFLSLLD